MERLIKNVLGLVFLVSIVTTGIAQLSIGPKKVNHQDVVYLNNGSIIRGELILYEQGQQVKIKTIDGSVWVFDATEVEKVNKEMPVAPSKVITTKEKGFYNVTDIGFNTGFDPGGVFIPSISFQMVNGYQMNPTWSYGFGMGVESFNYDPYMPFFVDVRYHLKDELFTPFTNLKSGAVLGIESASKGFFVDASVGVKNQRGDKSAFTFSLGYRFQYLEDKNIWWEWPQQTIKEIYQMHRLSIRLGFYFN